MHLVAPIRAGIDRTAGRVALVGADPRDDEDMRARKALLVLISVLILPVAALWGALYLVLGSPVGVVPFVYFAVLLGALVVFSRTRDFPKLLVLAQVDILLAPTLSMIPLGGFVEAGGVGLWGILAPLGTLVFSEVRTALRWYVAWVVVFLGSGIAGEIVGPRWDPLPVWFTTTMLALNITIGGAIVFTLLAVFASERRAALAALRVEQAKGENLLLNILPRSIAERLKAEDRPIADQFDSASILFADVVDFTPWSEQLPPSEVVGYLDRLFTHFDTLAERHGLEKIKTIGDCYMAAAGVPTPRPDHARVLALMALDMLEAMRSTDELGHLGLELRRHQLWPGRRRGDRPEALSLRPLGRRREHRQPHGVQRCAGPDPDHSLHVRAPARRVRVRAAGDDHREGERRDRGVVPGRPARERMMGFEPTTFCMASSA